jgi:hypothetical protein
MQQFVLTFMVYLLTKYQMPSIRALIFCLLYDLYVLCKLHATAFLNIVWARLGRWVNSPLGLTYQSGTMCLSYYCHVPSVCSVNLTSPLPGYVSRHVARWAMCHVTYQVVLLHLRMTGVLDLVSLLVLCFLFLIWTLDVRNSVPNPDLLAEVLG